MTEQGKEKEHTDLSNAPSATPILIAAKNGITEMVEKTLVSYPVAMYDMDQDMKNIVLLAVEHKQPCVYELLLSLKKKNVIKDSIFSEVDSDGNTALHLAAKKADFNWPVPGAAYQMQWEIKWYEYIKKTMRIRFLLLRNKNGKIPEEVFTETHEDLIKKAGLFVTVTFSTSTNVPDGIIQENKHKLSAKFFAGSSYVSFYTSLIAVIMFLSILTSGCRERDFRHALPWKLLLGLTAFYMSIASTLVSFTTGHFFISRDQLKSVSSSSYVMACLLVTFFAMAVFPLYFHLAWATVMMVPQRNYRLNIARFFKSRM
ncbi:isoform 4 of serine/threonine-protein phosphatase 6 regulatory ankyrin repeat subunit a [Fagus crenata]